LLYAEELKYKLNGSHVSKITINMQRRMRKKSKYITKENQKTMNEGKMGSDKTFRNNHETSNKMTTNTYLSIITLNVNGLNIPFKNHRVTKWIKKKKTPIYMLPETKFRPKETCR